MSVASTRCWKLVVYSLTACPAATGHQHLFSSYMHLWHKKRVCQKIRGGRDWGWVGGDGDVVRQQWWAAEDHAWEQSPSVTLWTGWFTSQCAKRPPLQTAVPNFRGTSGQMVTVMSEEQEKLRAGGISDTHLAVMFVLYTFSGLFFGRWTVTDPVTY